MRKFFKKLTLFLVLGVFCSAFIMFEMPGNIYGEVNGNDYVDGFLVSYMEPDGLDPYGKSYTATPAAVVEDTGLKELTDGILGINVVQWNGSCAGWNDDVSIVIDMEDDGARLNKFKIRYMVKDSFNNKPVTSATIYVTDDLDADPVVWTSVGEVDVPSVVDNSFQEAVLEFDNVVNGRGVKFEIDWDVEQNHYLMIDELFVYASMPVPEVSLVSNIDETGKGYTTTPSCAYATGNKSDNAGGLTELTDNVFGIATAEWNANLSVYDDNISTVIDMGDDGVRLFKFQVSYLVLDEEDEQPVDYGAITSATIYVSDDEENWTEVGEVDVPSPVDESFQKAVLELDYAVSGRYVKFDIVKSDTYLALDELSVWATKPDFLISSDEDLLPDGTEFDFWDDDTTYGTTYYVNNQHPSASDTNNGTSPSTPFKTINKAASVAVAGNKVLISAGVYLETIRDITGGTASNNMVMFEGVGDVVITGAVEWTNADAGFEESVGLREVAPQDEKDLFWYDADYIDTVGGDNVYMGKIPADLLEDGYNPFSIMNMAPIYFGGNEGSSPHMLALTNPLNTWNADPSMMKRGLLFFDNGSSEIMMRQVVRPHELWFEYSQELGRESGEGTYWVDESGRYIHFRLPSDVTYSTGTLKLAIREQGFAPDESGQSYIHLKNLTFEKFSNPFPPPQKGVISTNCGHHWIVEDCTVEDVNGVGLDMGFLSHYHYHEGTRGHHIVRGSSFINCGIGGIAALPTQGDYLESMLVEDNIFDGCCWHDTEPLWESAGIKNHYTEDSLYRNNLIMNTKYGTGIWLDKAIKNTRVCNNIIYNVEHSLFGGIQIEATYDKNLVDHNFIFTTTHREPPNDGTPCGGHGIYLGEVDNIGVYGNIIANLEGDGIYCLEPFGEPRPIGTYVRKTTYGCGNQIMRNIIDGCDYYMTWWTRYNFSDENMIEEADPPYSSSTDTFRIRSENDRDTDVEGTAEDDDTEFFDMDDIQTLFGWENNGYIGDGTDISVALDQYFSSTNRIVDITVGEYAVNDLDLGNGEIYDFIVDVFNSEVGGLN